MSKRGRPKKGVTQERVLQVRVTPEVKKYFEQASRLAELSLSSWARERLMATARKELQNFAAKPDISS
jgi:predicted HicB family RNase H-like nuclease